MSIIGEISRIGATMAKAHRAHRAARQLNELPEEVQKDIGWPAASHERRKNELFLAMWNTYR